MSGDLSAVARQAALGDQTALTRFVTETSRAVWRVCAALVDPGSADDLAQETYVRAVRSLPGYRGDSGPVPWLATIARRVCAEEIERRQRARHVVRRLIAERPPRAVESAPMSEITELIGGLPPVRRDAFLLTAVAGLSYDEAAAACGCPVGTIRSRVARARAQLIEALGTTEQIADGTG